MFFPRSETLLAADRSLTNRELSDWYHEECRRRANPSLSFKCSWRDKKAVLDTFLATELADWEQGERKAILFIKLSLEEIRSKLIAAGWKPEMTTAKYHYNFIMSTVPKMDKFKNEDLHDQSTEDVMPKGYNVIEVVRKMISIRQADCEYFHSHIQIGFFRPPDRPHVCWNVY